MNSIEFIKGLNKRIQSLETALDENLITDFISLHLILDEIKNSSYLKSKINQGVL